MRACQSSAARRVGSAGACPPPPRVLSRQLFLYAPDPQARPGPPLFAAGLAGPADCACGRGRAEAPGGFRGAAGRSTSRGCSGRRLARARVCRRAGGVPSPQRAGDASEQMPAWSPGLPSSCRVSPAPTPCRSHLFLLQRAGALPPSASAPSSLARRGGGGSLAQPGKGAPRSLPGPARWRRGEMRVGGGETLARSRFGKGAWPGESAGVANTRLQGPPRPQVQGGTASAPHSQREDMACLTASCNGLGSLGVRVWFRAGGEWDAQASLGVGSQRCCFLQVGRRAGQRGAACLRPPHRTPPHPERGAGGARAGRQLGGSLLSNPRLPLFVPKVTASVAPAVGCGLCGLPHLLWVLAGAWDWAPVSVCPALAFGGCCWGQAFGAPCSVMCSRGLGAPSGVGRLLRRVPWLPGAGRLELPGSPASAAAFRGQCEDRTEPPCDVRRPPPGAAESGAGPTGTTGLCLPSAALATRAFSPHSRQALACPPARDVAPPGAAFCSSAPQHEPHSAPLCVPGSAAQP